MTTRNPYAPPDAEVADPLPALETESPIPNGRRVSIAHGARWISGSFRLWTWKWLGASLLLFVGSVVLSLLPALNLLSTILWYVVGGGIALAMNNQRTTGTFALEDVFAGFRVRSFKLAAVGAVMLVAYAAWYFLVASTIGTEEANALLVAGTWEGEFTGELIATFLLGLAVIFLVTFAGWLAPALIMLHDMAPLEAMKMSLIATLKNILPAIVASVLLVLLIAVSVVPLGLGLLFSLPLALIVPYVAYRDMFFDHDEPQ